MKCDRDISVSDKQVSYVQSITERVNSGNFCELLSYMVNKVLNSFWVFKYGFLFFWEGCLYFDY